MMNIKEIFFNIFLSRRKRYHIHFNNIPINNEKKDIFGFFNQVKIINQAIKNDSLLIGIVGDYGSGKSSLTELCQKKLSYKYKKSIKINMWDTLDKDDHNFNFLMRSFLYQLAQGNNKKNIHFAQYINERQSRNFGKLSLTMSTYWALLLFIIAGLFGILYFSLTNASIFEHINNYLELNKMKETLKVLNILKIFSYPILFLSIIFIFWGIKIGAFVFSLWNSQGKVTPEYGDIFDNFIHIMNRITRLTFPGYKKIIYIEDLDRINEKDFVIVFLKELHRFINILPYKQKRKIAFIVSLKSEASLRDDLMKKKKYNETTNISDNEKDINVEKSKYLGILIDDSSTYSKIFDYTLWIKPIHYENISDITFQLLIQNKKQINSVMDRKMNEDNSKFILEKLFWIQQGINITIRELKDRLNETFNLFQTLKERDFKNSSVELNKCCAVAYLHRAYPPEYEELIKHEQDVAELIRECYFFQNKDEKSIHDKVNIVIDNIFIDKNIFKNIVKFSQDLSNMIYNADIDEDFMMYFYNYPISSYIKSLDEKEIFNYIIHPSEKYKSDEQLSNKINRIIEQRKGIIIEIAINELKEKKQFLPDIIFFNKELFLFVFNKYSNIVFQTFKSYSLEIINSPNKISSVLKNIFSFDVDEENKNKIINYIVTNIVKNINGQDVTKIIALRIELIKHVNNDIVKFSDIFIDSRFPLITKDELINIERNYNKLKLINPKLINENNCDYLFEYFSKNEFINDDYNIIENIILSIDNFDKIKNIHFYLLNILRNCNKYNDTFFTLIIKNVKDDDKELLCKYLNNFDISIIPEEQLKIVDKLMLTNITNINTIKYFEEKKLVRSTLLSRVSLGIINEFDFTNNTALDINCFIDICKSFYNEFIAIRFVVFKQIHDKETNLYELFQGEFPLIQNKEIDLINDPNKELYMYLNHNLIDSTNFQLITNYCNMKMFSNEELYSFFNTLFLNNERKITDIKIIKNILSNINFKNNINFDSITQKQQDIIINIFDPIYKLTTAKGSMEFMSIINCLIPKLEDVVINNLLIEKINYSDYINLINEIKKPSEKTLEIINNQPLTINLDEVVLKALFEKNYFTKYLIGRTIKDNIVPINDNIPIQRYYNAYISSETFEQLCSENQNILSNIVINELLDEKITNEKLIHFYKLRQPLYLIKFILTRLKGDFDKIKIYLLSIQHIDTEKDADDFINLITSSEFIEVFKDKEIYRFLYQKMWNKNMKQKLTARVNKKLGTNYYGGEGGEVDISLLN